MPIQDMHVYILSLYIVLSTSLSRDIIISTMKYMSLITITCNFSGHEITIKTFLGNFWGKKFLTIITVSFLDFILIYTFLHIRHHESRAKNINKTSTMCMGLKNFKAKWCLEQCFGSDHLRKTVHILKRQTLHYSTLVLAEH